MKAPLCVKKALVRLKIKGCLLFQYDAEGASFAAVGLFYKDFSFVVILNDSLGEGKPESPPGFLGGESWLKDRLVL